MVEVSGSKSPFFLLAAGSSAESRDSNCLFSIDLLASYLENQLETVNLCEKATIFG